MNKYKLTIKLLSNTFIGSGSGFSSIIDSDVVFDEFGLPYIPAKRVKGCIRNSAREIKDMFKLSDLSKPNFPELEDLFGKDGSLEYSKIIFNNLYLENSQDLKICLTSLFRHYSGIYNKDSVINNFTSVNKQTTIDEYGIAEKNSLRTFRYLKKGLIFSGFIETSLPEETLILLTLAIDNFRTLGTKRNRGYGEVQCNLEGLKDIKRKCTKILQEAANV